jgi:hypothetical protein
VSASSEPASEIPVNPDNFIRAETDLYFSRITADNGFGQFMHIRELTPLDKQLVIRQNRDTLYSAAVFDLEASDVTFALPDSGDRFMAAQVITQDHYVPEVIYDQALRRFTREGIGTRYVMLAVRTLLNPDDPDDVRAVHALQDAIQVQQTDRGSFEIPHWDQASQATVREALAALAATLPDSKGMFGTPETTTPVRRLIGAAAAWGGNPEADAFYLNTTPARNDGDTVHRLTVGDVPVDGFWSITVYNQDGYFTQNALNRYSFNSITAKPGDDGTTTIQFGGCDGHATNCIPVTPGWNYMVRLYRPEAPILNGEWTFPVAEPC